LVLFVVHQKESLPKIAEAKFGFFENFLKITETGLQIFIRN